MLTSQCIFKDFEGTEHQGILVDIDYIICLCCGRVFTFDDDDIELVEIFTDGWRALEF